MTEERDPVPRRRTILHAFLEVRGVLGGHTRPHVRLPLHAADGTRLSAWWLPGPTLDAPAVGVAHGFGAHARKPAYARLAAHLSDRVHVLAVDLRGHGGSAGATTLGDREALDVAAAVDWVRGRGHDRVGLVGVSMGPRRSCTPSPPASRSTSSWWSARRPASVIPRRRCRCSA